MTCPPGSNPSDNCRRGGCLGRLVKLVLLAVLLALVAGGWLWFSKPAYWKQYDRQDPHLARQAQRLEQRLPTEITRVRPLGQPWQIRLTQDEINGWLATRLPKWLANQRPILKQYRLPSRLPEEVRQIMVAIEPTFIALAIQIQDQGLEQVVSIEFRPFIGGNGLARLQMTGFKGGRLWLPQGLLDQLIAKYGSLEKAQPRLLSKFSRMLLQTDLAWPADQHRLVEVMNIQLQRGIATVTCRTVLKKDAVANGPWRSQKLEKLNTTSPASSPPASAGPSAQP